LDRFNLIFALYKPKIKPMIFFALSFLASMLGGYSASIIPEFTITLNIPSNPFSGIIAFWPFIVALVVLLLAIMWYQNIKNLQRRRKTSGVQRRPGTNSMVFMGVVTVFVVVLLASPWYFQNLTEKQQQDQGEIAPENRTEVILTVHGMDCGGCESLVQRKVASLNGIESVSASHVREEAFIVYDKSKVSIDLIAQTIEEAGYTVILER
jgi:mercuric ion transport protein